MLSQTAEYALRAMVYLATTHPDPVTSADVAEACQISPEYLAKILLGLRKAGLVASRRGRNGGSILTRGPDTITLLDVVDCVDPVAGVTECPRGIAEHCEELCPLHRLLNEQAERFRAELDRATILEMASGSPAAFPLFMTPKG